MLDFLKELSQARMDTLFVLSGLAFLAVAVLGNITGTIQPGKGGRIASAVLGPFLIAFGLSIHTADHLPDRRPDNTVGSTSTTRAADDAPSRGTAPSAPARPIVSPPTSGADDTSAGSAPLENYTGTWKNVDAQTRGITTVQVRAAGNQAWIHAWGSCHPTDCDWGEVQANAFAPGVSSASVRNLGAVYTTGFNQTNLMLRLASPQTLTVETATHFTDNSGRSDYSATYSFRRAP